MRGSPNIYLYNIRGHPKSQKYDLYRIALRGYLNHVVGSAPDLIGCIYNPAFIQSPCSCSLILFRTFQQGYLTNIDLRLQNQVNHYSYIILMVFEG